MQKTVNKIIFVAAVFLLFAGGFTYAASTTTTDSHPPIGSCQRQGDCACKEWAGNVCNKYPRCINPETVNDVQAGEWGWCENPYASGFEIPAFEFPSPTGSATFADLICSVTGFISSTILPPLAVLMMLVVGFLFLTSGGIPQRAGLAQKALLFTMAGVALLVLAPGIVVLIGDLFNNTSLKTAPACSLITTGTIVDALLKTVNWFSWFVAITSVAMGLYSGFLYITARDNPQQIQQAAKVLSYVIIGIAVSILAFSIVTITKQLMGL